MLKTAREATGLSQEEASWKLHIGRRTLSDYENGKSFVPPDVIDRMAEVYRQPRLRQRYCSEYCPLMKIHDQIEDTDFPTAVLGLVNEHNHLGELLKQLIAIAADGKIGDDEVEQYRVIDKEMRHLRQKITTLQALSAVS